MGSKRDSGENSDLIDEPVLGIVVYRTVCTKKVYVSRDPNPIIVSVDSFSLSSIPSSAEAQS